LSSINEMNDGRFPMCIPAESDGSCLIQGSGAVGDGVNDAIAIVNYKKPTYEIPNKNETALDGENVEGFEKRAGTLDLRKLKPNGGAECKSEQASSTRCMPGTISILGEITN